MTNNIEIIKTSYEGIETEHVIIERAPGEFTSMPKAVYDAQQEDAPYSTEIVPPSL